MKIDKVPVVDDMEKALCCVSVLCMVKDWYKYTRFRLTGQDFHLSLPSYQVPAEQATVADAYGVQLLDVFAWMLHGDAGVHMPRPLWLCIWKRPYIRWLMLETNNSCRKLT